MIGRPRYSLVLGRFQPLHLGHLEYLEAARKRGDHLVVGITNPDSNKLIADRADKNRSRPDSNPFSYFDRYQMITDSLCEDGGDGSEFMIVPAPINTPAEMTPFLPRPEVTVVCITIYDEWGDRKANIMTGLGYEVEVLWRRNVNDRLTSGTKIRHLMRTGGDWRSFVPPAVTRYLDDGGWAAALEAESLRGSPRTRVTGETPGCLQFTWSVSHQK